MNPDIELKHLPKHVAIIMDGNGRWAKERGLPRTEGHIQGQEALRRTLRAAAEFGIQVLTVYAFSTENWNRPKEEVDALMELLVRAIHAETDELMKEGVRLEAIGDLGRLPQTAQDSLKECIERTAGNTQITMVLALSYSSRDEIVRATRALMQKAVAGSLTPDELSEDLFSEHLDTRNYPELDLLIRTGGDQRISNYLLWQSAYAELVFTDTYWPDFGKEALREALVTYQGRERRFGQTSEQIQLLDD